jgi:hypothetical protein
MDVTFLAVIYPFDFPWHPYFPYCLPKFET